MQTNLCIRIISEFIENVIAAEKLHDLFKVLVVLVLELESLLVFAVYNFALAACAVGESRFQRGYVIHDYRLFFGNDRFVHLLIQTVCLFYGSFGISYGKIAVDASLCKVDELAPVFQSEKCAAVTCRKRSRGSGLDTHPSHQHMGMM